MARFFTLLATIAAFALVMRSGGLAAQQSQGPWPLADVQVEGAQRYAPAEVISLSGLELGQTISTADLQKVADELMGTGLFRRLGFGYAVAPDGGLRLTLRIEEPAWTVPLVFDNVIWMTDEELTAALAARVPAFNGTVVEDGYANDFIANAAEQVLAERGITTQIDIEPRLDLRSNASSYALVVRESPTSLRVCSVAFEGATAVPAGTQNDLVEPFVGRDYSKGALVQLANGSLRQEYRARGYWRATFGVPTATPAPGNCDGLAVTVPVNEGTPYDFAGARWVGASVFDEAALDRSLNLRVGSVADGRRLQSGLSALEREYHEQGYLAVATGVTAEFDDAARRVTFVVEVREGPQFRMGSLSVVGLPDRQSTDTTRRWRLKQGDVFNGVYYNEFLGEQSRRVGGGLRGEARLNHDTATVDVTFSVGP